MSTRSRKLGGLEIFRVLELVTPFSAFDFFPETTEEDWAPHRHWLEPDAMDPKTGKLKLPIQSYVVRTTHHTILIDGCVGNDKSRENRPHWHLKSDTTYLAALAAHGLDPADIDFVLCTHLHSDHVGWNTRLESGRWVPTFPNARYVFSKQEVELWRDVGHEKFSRTPYEDSVLPIIEAGRAELVANDYALDDEVSLEPTPGHTPGHVAISLKSKGAAAVMCGDLMHSPVQCLYPEWTAWPDWDAEQAKQTRWTFLDRYCESDTLICTAHFPLPSAGHIIRAEEAYRFVYDEPGW